MRPRLGFVGLGWIGLDRLKAASEAAEIAAICDPSDEACERARAVAPAVVRADDLDVLLDLQLDGVVLATPSALHADQCVRALEAGVPVFCQKPLGRDAAEVERVVAAARRADRRVGVDLSYRHTRALEAIREVVRGGGIGPVHAVDLVFHNAYGPDKAWYRDRRQSGGGCVVDLGIHLVDAALWVLGGPEVERVSGAAWAGGRRLAPGADENEDFAVADLDLVGGCRVRLACSWWLPAGRDAEIGLDFWGREGAARLRNVDGSFYAFTADLCRGTRAERLVDPPDAWGGRGIVRWVADLVRDRSYDAELEQQIVVARVLERIVA